MHLNEDHSLAMASNITNIRLVKTARDLIEHLEEERQLGLFFGVILLGSMFALVGAGLSMYWLYRKTHPDAYRRSSLHDLQRLRSTSSTNDDVKKSMV
ncbi:uncharacterized protein LOC111135862 isoform X1 [Crassostrea virginica]